MKVSKMMGDDTFDKAIFGKEVEEHIKNFKPAPNVSIVNSAHLFSDDAKEIYASLEPLAAWLAKNNFEVSLSKIKYHGSQAVAKIMIKHKVMVINHILEKELQEYEAYPNDKFKKDYYIKSKFLYHAVEKKENLESAHLMSNNIIILPGDYTVFQKSFNILHYPLSRTRIIFYNYKNFFSPVKEIIESAYNKGFVTKEDKIFPEFYNNINELAESLEGKIQRPKIHWRDNYAK